MIEINNLTALEIDKNFLKEVAGRVLKAEKNFSLSVALVGPDRIKELNRKYRKKNKTTDVLSFSYNNSGEIVICLVKVKKNAKESASTFKKELSRCLIHGILHLLGYDHEKNKKKAKEMKKKEDYYLS